MINQLAREEYVEQAYLFRTMKARVQTAEPVQELLGHLREEILATTKLPMAIDYLLAELNHTGTMASAMERMQHYFAPFQTYLIHSAESEKGRFDIRMALAILELEAGLRAAAAPAVAMFFFQFETLSRNRLEYDAGLHAIAGDPVYDEGWRNWILKVRHQIGLVELADLVYVHSEHYIQREEKSGLDFVRPDPLLFNEKVGRIALANRKKQPTHFFAALQRQMEYPAVPKPERKDPNEDMVPKLVRLVERLETRLKLLEDEQRQSGIDLSQFYEKPNQPPTEI
jgi:hypothetical protein